MSFSPSVWFCPDVSLMRDQRRVMCVAPPSFYDVSSQNKTPSAQKWFCAIYFLLLLKCATSFVSRLAVTLKKLRTETCMYFKTHQIIINHQCHHIKLVASQVEEAGKREKPFSVPYVCL